jgi:hypothetical protein
MARSNGAGRGARGSGTRAELALRAMVAWGAEQDRKSADAVRLVLVPNPDSKGEGPDGEFAVPLR